MSLVKIFYIIIFFLVKLKFCFSTQTSLQKTQCLAFLSSRLFENLGKSNKLIYQIHNENQTSYNASQYHPIYWILNQKYSNNLDTLQASRHSTPCFRVFFTLPHEEMVVMEPFMDKVMALPHKYGLIFILFSSRQVKCMDSWRAAENPVFFVVKDLPGNQVIIHYWHALKINLNLKV